MRPEFTYTILLFLLYFELASGQKKTDIVSETIRRPQPKNAQIIDKLLRGYQKAGRPVLNVSNQRKNCDNMP